MNAPALPSDGATRQAACPPGSPALDRTVFLLVVLAAVATASVVYVRFLESHRHLWTHLDHDRNAHHLLSLKLARATQDGEVLGVFGELNKARVWGPVYSILSGCVMVGGGADYRLAVLPSLAGWVGAVLFAFLLARRCVPAHGSLAGVTAAFFLLISPGYQGYAADIMLESLGACFSLAALYCYLVAVQEGYHWSGRLLGLALTVLFLHKYNYWLLVLLSLVLAELIQRSRLYGSFLQSTWRHLGLRQWLAEQPRQVSSWILAVLLVLCAAITLRGDRPLALAGHSIRVYPPFNILQVTYLLVLFRLALWWRGRGRAWASGLDFRYRQLLAWHAWPVLIKLALPGHLGYFLWFLSPANTASEGQGFLEALRFYSTVMMEYYHVTTWSAAAALVLVVVALFPWRRLREGGVVVGCFFLVGLLLTSRHPNVQPRFLHSWLAAGWVLAGVGVAGLLPVRLRQKAPRACALLLAGVVLTLFGLHLPALRSLPSPREGGPQPAKHSNLDIVEAYQPYLETSSRAAILTSLPIRFLAEWTALERFGRGRLEEVWWGFGARGEDNRRKFAGWLETTGCDTIVYVDQAPWIPLSGHHIEVLMHAELRDVLLGSKEFALVRRHDLPAHGCSVLVFQKPEHTARLHQEASR